MKHKESRLKKSIRESLKKVLKESFREDFFDWYDFLSPEEQHRVDTWCEEEGYPEFLSDCSNSDLEIIMDHFNPDFFESKKVCEEKVTEGKLRPFTKSDWYGYAGAEKFPDGSEPLIYEDPGPYGGAVIVSYDSYTDDIIVEVDYINDDDSVNGFVKTYQGDREKAIADAEEIISKGILKKYNPKYFGSDWSWAG